MKSYLVRNRTSAVLTLKDLLDESAKGRWHIRGRGGIDNSEDELNVLANEGRFNPHKEQVVRLLGSKDKGSGVVCDEGLIEGISNRFVIRLVISPRHIWTSPDEFLEPTETDPEKEVS
ncbi:MAG: hypothetical protein ACFFD3_11140 [Candidatus Thorarchaeota archaeon]